MNVIEVRNLGKRYRIGKEEKRADTVLDAIVNGLKSPLQNLRQIRNLSRLDREEDSVFWALRDVSFEVKQGEVLGIIGHNGAGKSTLLKILSRITEPSTGEVLIKGRVAALLEVGTGFHPELTGRENVYMNGTILGMRKREIDQKLDQIVDFSGVQKYLDTPVKFYSSGMRVRLGFSVAAHLEPEILIIDEVLAVGDAEFQAKCLGKMQDVSNSGRTVLFVSHNLSAVNSLCTRGIVLRNGIVVFNGNQSEAISTYRAKLLSFSGEEFIRTDTFQQEVVQSLTILDDSTNSNADAINVVSIGSNASIIIELDSGNKSFERCNLSVGIFGSDDQLMVAFKSVVQYNKPWTLKGKKTITVKWKNLNLIPGEYHLKCAFTTDKIKVDDIMFAGRLRVVLDRDIYQSGNSINQNQGVLVPNSNWVI